MFAPNPLAWVPSSMLVMTFSMAISTDATDPANAPIVTALPRNAWPCPEEGRRQRRMRSVRSGNIGPPR